MFKHECDKTEIDEAEEVFKDDDNAEDIIAIEKVKEKDASEITVNEPENDNRENELVIEGVLNGKGPIVIIDINEENEVIDNEREKEDINPDKAPAAINFKCKKCDFGSEDRKQLKAHKAYTHHWCEFCFSNFNNQENLHEHIKKNHKQ